MYGGGGGEYNLIFLENRKKKKRKKKKFQSALLSPLGCWTGNNFFLKGGLRSIYDLYLDVIS